MNGCCLVSFGNKGKETVCTSSAQIYQESNDISFLQMAEFVHKEPKGTESIEL